MKKYFTFLIIIVGFSAADLTGQSAAEWHSDIDLLTAKIEKYHPMPWQKISREDFLLNAAHLKSSLAQWPREKIVVEVMKLVASLKDGHTEVLLNSQEDFNLWFPLRFEKFYDGIFVTAADSQNCSLLGSKILSFDSVDAETVYERVCKVVASDNYNDIHYSTVNYLSNAVILKNIDILTETQNLELEVLTQEGIRKKVSLNAQPWGMWNNWSWNQTNVPTFHKKNYLLESKLKDLPLYLKNIIPNRIPYWFEYLPANKILYFQFSSVSNWNNDPFTEFTSRIFDTLEENIPNIEKLVIDLRFNEGGNGYLLTPFVMKFIEKKKLFDDCQVYLITGIHTFSAAPNFIGQMLKFTNAVSAGDLAPGPLNWCSDVMDFLLPNSNLTAHISTMYWQTGHPTDNRGYYPPDYYIPATFQDYISGTDPVMESIKMNNVNSLKKILLNDGADKFLEEYNRRKNLYGGKENWFPYTSFDLIMIAYFNLIPEGKTEDAVKLLKLNAELYPEDFRSWYALAEVCKETGMKIEALNAYDELFREEPDIKDAVNNYNSLIAEDTFVEKGISALKDVMDNIIANRPNGSNERILENIGRDRLKANKVRDAVSIFNLNVELFPGSANAYFSLGECYLKSGQTDLAVSNFKKVLEINPGDKRASKLLGEISR